MDRIKTQELSTLKIYKASAGSGKTYILARDYIRLVITDPELFRHCLAVTFTNKATGEMKHRILEELHTLSSGGTSTMMDFIASENGLSEKEVCGRAKIILESILHNYSRFRIETIDRFFQRAIRAFTRELGLAGGYQIELDSERVLSEAIDEMLMGLDRDPVLLEWFVEFARDRVQEGLHWNLKKDLMVLGQELNKEKFQMGSETLVRQLEDKEFFDSFRRSLMELKYRFEGSLKADAARALEIMKTCGLQAGDFKGQYGVGYFFDRLMREEFRPPPDSTIHAADELSGWHSKNSPKREQIARAYHAGMNDLLKHCIRLYESRYTEYLSAESVRNFLYTLGIIGDISIHMHACTESQGIFLLSDAGRFLHGIIGGNDVPFIYEKIGNYFQHYMIDEFQDTSRLQWENFRPLIENSLANNRECLVVGDVKQSIYRWRNSDWEILSERVQNNFSPEQIQVQGLKQNWRSLENIIRFNNEFFTRAAEIFHNHFSRPGEDREYDFAEKAAHAFRDVVQEVPDLPHSGDGYIRVGLLDDPEEGNWKDLADRRVIDTIARLQDEGIKASEIAILVRSRRDGKRIADAILNHKSRHPDPDHVYDVVSNESLYLNSSRSVRILLNAFRYLIAPADRLNLAQLVFEYNLFKGREKGNTGPVDELLDFLREDREPDLPEEFLDESLRYLTLTELTERIIAIFSLADRVTETPYILGFQDIILEYCRNGAADINSFLNWWNENGEGKSLAFSEDQDAIKVMTIHKAKGLEFKAVIIPYCNWSFDHTSPNPEILWCSPRQEPFNALSILPVRYSSGLKETLFRHDYHEENFRIFMDHLNLLYVAFTRARECLIVYAPEGREEKLSDVGVLVRTVLKNPDSLTTGVWDDSRSSWSLGSFSFRPSSGPTGNQIVLGRISSHEFSGKLRLMYRGMDFFDLSAEQRVQYGTLMHEIFARIRSADDVGRALDSVRREGMIDSGEAGRLEPEVRSMIRQAKVSQWFDGSWRVITEQDILTGEGTVRRPDRVMLKEGRVIVVDYKFGEQRLAGHLSQVRKYADMLRRMDYREVQGFIWYVKRTEVVEV